jgi:hypothetical protein
LRCDDSQMRSNTGTLLAKSRSQEPAPRIRAQRGILITMNALGETFHMKSFSRQFEPWQLILSTHQNWVVIIENLRQGCNGVKEELRG